MSFSILPVSEPGQLLLPAQTVSLGSGAGDPAGNEKAVKSGTNKGEFSPLEKSQEQADADISRLQETLAAHGVALEFSRDDETNQVVVKLIDQQTGEALRQMPTEVSLKLTAELGRLQGYILNRKI